MINPIVGMPVHFFHTAEHRARHGDEPQAAVVTRSFGNGVVNLVAFDGLGVPSGYHEIRVFDGDGDRPDGAYCEAIKQPRADDGERHDDPTRHLSDEELDNITKPATPNRVDENGNPVEYPV